jgi:hypothetical protein
MYGNHTGLPPVDPELVARHSRRQSIQDRFTGTVIGVAALIVLLVVLSVIGRFLA